MRSKKFLRDFAGAMLCITGMPGAIRRYNRYTMPSAKSICHHLPCYKNKNIEYRIKNIRIQKKKKKKSQNQKKNEYTAPSRCRQRLGAKSGYELSYVR